MQEPREGGCLCGAVRYRVTNAPFRTSVCHCTFCQRRTGSAFGLGAYFKKDDFELLSGELRSYEHRSDESGHKISFRKFIDLQGSAYLFDFSVLKNGYAIAHIEGFLLVMSDKNKSRLHPLLNGDQLLLHL